MKKTHKICLRKLHLFFTFYLFYWLIKLIFIFCTTSFCSTYLPRQLCDVFDFIFLSSFTQMHERSIGSHTVTYMITMSLNSIYYMPHLNSLQSIFKEKCKIQWRNHNLRNKKCCLTKIFDHLVHKKHIRQQFPGKKWQNNFFNVLSSFSLMYCLQKVLVVLSLSYQYFRFWKTRLPDA